MNWCDNFLFKNPSYKFRGEMDDPEMVVDKQSITIKGKFSGYLWILYLP